MIEKCGTIEHARTILSKLRNYKFDKCWKIYLEGALLEMRFGNVKYAERVLKCLNYHLDFNG